MNPLVQLKTTSLPLLTALMLTCFALSPQSRATCQEGCDLINGNAFLGDNALISNTTGSGNTAVGSNALFSNTTGIYNAATGANALSSNTTGFLNTATGFQSLAGNTTGFSNTATGFNALFLNTTGNSNTATGFQALDENTTGSFNTAMGAEALLSNRGNNNTATGFEALNKNTTGNDNTANGVYALASNTTGTGNTAIGRDALTSSRTGNNNTANGVGALQRNRGSGNIALGVSSGANLTTGDNNIDIGNSGLAGEANTIRIGAVGTQTNTFIAGISGVTVAGGVAVVIDANGHLGTSTSSARYKEAIKPIDKASEAILALQPVTFRYKRELDPQGIPQFGLVAEDVQTVNPDLIARDEQGKPYTVRYEAVNAMLLNEFLKEHRKVEQLEATVAQQRKDFRAITAEQQRELKSLGARLEEQAAQIRKVTGQLQLSKTATQIVRNDR